MNILFLTIGGFKNPNQNGVYTDLLRYFLHKEHSVYTVCQRERREKLPTIYEKEAGIHILRVKTGNITKVGFIEKGITTLMIESQYRHAINKFFKNITFDIVLYSTPPITLASLVRKFRQKHQAFTYLMLKDIFPQNAVDLGILKKTGILGGIYCFFRQKERQLYRNSDKIGCMSLANQEYLLKHNPDLQPDKTEICPNTLDSVCLPDWNKADLRRQLQLPPDKVILLYGGNFGKPQNVDYIIEVLKASSIFTEFHFVMCGAGTEFYRISDYAFEKPSHVTVFNNMPYEDYTKLVSACDIGMLFLDYRFSIPNFPSRILDYLNYGLPVVAATDKNTDVGKVIVKGGFGWWCESSQVDNFLDVLKQIKTEMSQLSEKGKMAKQYMIDNYSTGYAYEKIICAYENWKRSLYV